MEFDRDKLKRLIHYIVWKTSDAAKLGATKLNKILWFSDAQTYVLHKKPITGEAYVRKEHGPVARHFNEAWKELEREGAITHHRDKFFGRDKHVYRAKRAPDMQDFSSEEMKIVEYFRRYVTEEHTATTISEESHDYGWEIAEMEEPLPYFAILAKRGRAPQGDELEWAKDVAKRRKMP